MTKNHTSMTSISGNDDRLMRYGHPLYEVNPSLPRNLAIEQPSQESSSGVEDREIQPFHLSSNRVEHCQKSNHVDREILTESGVVSGLDREKFVKIYLAGVRQYARLNKSGTSLFEFIYEQLSRHESQDKDLIYLNYILASKWNPGLMRRTYSRGIATGETIFISIDG
jgi:hypothetical protein